MATSLSTRKAIAFFRKHAGYSWNSGAGETEAEGRSRCARQLARAEREGKRAGLTFRWVRDDDYDNRMEGLWMCTAFHESGECLASLGGIDLSNGHPYPYGATPMGAPLDIGGRDPYCRVVEAELAMEALAP